MPCIAIFVLIYSKKNPDFHQDCILVLFVSFISNNHKQSLLPKKEIISVAKIKTVIGHFNVVFHKFFANV